MPDPTGSKGLCFIKLKEKKVSRSAVPRRVNEGFHVIEIPLERAAAERRQAILGPRHPPLERLRARDVLRILELPRMDAEVSVARLHQPLQVVEAEQVVHREGTDDAKAHPLVDELVQFEWARPAAGDGAQRVGRSP